MKILLVDDEGIVLRGISTIIKRADRDWEIVAECGSGEEALPAIDYYCPDVVISDIRMYSISGIDLAEKIREKHPGTLVILLTGYAEFSYAQQAVKLNIFDYLLKPSRYEDILDCLSRAEARINEAHKKRVQETVLTSKLQESQLILREKFLQDLMKGLLPVSVNVAEKLNEYRITLKRFIVLNVGYESMNRDFSNDCRDKSLLDCGVKNIFTEVFADIKDLIIITENLQNFVVIIEADSMNDDWQEIIPKLALSAVELMLEKLNVRLYIGGSEAKDNPEELFDCYNQSHYAMEKAKEKEENILFFKDLNYILPKNSYSKTIQAAIDCIDRTFHEDISLKDVAEAVYLNVWYLSDLFKREVGKTFSDYVKDKRIELAKKLLKDNSLKLYEVAYRVGIREQSYFSSLFKKETGMTPKKFREQFE